MSIRWEGGDKGAEICEVSRRSSCIPAADGASNPENYSTDARKSLRPGFETHTLEVRPKWSDWRRE